MHMFLGFNSRWLGDFWWWLIHQNFLNRMMVHQVCCRNHRFPHVSKPELLPSRHKSGLIELQIFTIGFWNRIRKWYWYWYLIPQIILIRIEPGRDSPLPPVASICCIHSTTEPWTIFKQMRLTALTFKRSCSSPRLSHFYCQILHGRNPPSPNWHSF